MGYAVHGVAKSWTHPSEYARGLDKLKISICTQAVKYKQHKGNFPFVINLLEVSMLSSSMPSGNDIMRICKQRSKSTY